MGSQDQLRMICTFCHEPDELVSIISVGDRAYHWPCLEIWLELTMSECRKIDGMDYGFMYNFVEHRFSEEYSLMASATRRLVESYADPRAVNILFHMKLVDFDKCLCLVHALSVSASHDFLHRLGHWISSDVDVLPLKPVFEAAYRAGNAEILRTVLAGKKKAVIDEVFNDLVVRNALGIIQWLFERATMSTPNVNLKPAIYSHNIALCEYLIQHDFCRISFTTKWIKDALIAGSFEIHQLLCNHLKWEFLDMIRNSVNHKDTKCLEIYLASYDCLVLRELLKTALLEIKGIPELSVLKWYLEHADLQHFLENLNRILRNFVSTADGTRSIETITYLLEKGADPFVTDGAFYHACKSDVHTEIVKLFIDSAMNRPELNSQDHLFANQLVQGALHAIDHFCFENFRLAALHKHFPLHHDNDLIFRRTLRAYENSDDAYPEKRTILTNIIHMLIDLRANIHADEDFALYAACKNDNLPLVSRLLTMGADPDARGSRALKAAKIDETSLCVGYLMEAGVDFCVDDKFIFKKALERDSVSIFFFTVDVRGQLDPSLFPVILKHRNVKFLKLFHEYYPELPSPSEYRNEIIWAMKFGHYDTIKHLVDIGWIGKFEDDHVYAAVESGETRLLDLVWPIDSPKMVPQFVAFDPEKGRKCKYSAYDMREILSRLGPHIEMAKALAKRTHQIVDWYQSVVDHAARKKYIPLYTHAIMAIRRLGGTVPSSAYQLHFTEGGDCETLGIEL